MLESPNKQMKLLNNLPEDLVVRISSFLPIQSLSKNCLVSRLFRHTEIRSLDLDFSRMFAVRRSQLEAVNIIQNVFNKHEGSEINRFVLCLKEIGAEESIASWINTCIRKYVQELVLDFSKSRHVMEIPIDFSAIKTLTVLHLRWCKFEIPDNSPKGLRLLKTLSLMRTEVTKEMIEAIFRNCIHLESLELIKCHMYGLLSIPAYNHKKFKSLVVSSIPNLVDIVSYAPNLEYFKYDGYVMNVFFLRTEGFFQAGDVDMAQNIFKQMVCDGVHPDIMTCNIFLDGLCNNGKLEEALVIFQDLQKSEMVEGMCKAGKVEDASGLFCSLNLKGVKPNVVTYTTMISGFCGKGLMQEADILFRKMKEDGPLPDDYTYNTLISAHLRDGDTAASAELVKEMRNCGFAGDASTFSFLDKSFLDMLS